MKLKKRKKELLDTLKDMRKELFRFCKSKKNVNYFLCNTVKVHTKGSNNNKDMQEALFQTYKPVKDGLFFKHTENKYYIGSYVWWNYNQGKISKWEVNKLKLAYLDDLIQHIEDELK